MRIVLVTGPGGAGKTTEAAATGLALADRGVRTLVLSVGPGHSLGDVLDAPVGAEPVEVAPGLSALHLESQLRLEDAWRGVPVRLLDLLAHTGVEAVTADELAVLPGIDEVLALLALRAFADSGRWDAIVVDCPSSAATIRLLALPETLGWYLRRLFPAHRRIARTIRPLVSLLGRADALPETRLDALLRLAQDLAGVQALLADPATTSVRLVLPPGVVAAADARRTITALALYGYAVDLLVSNGVVGASFADLPIREVAQRAAEPIGADTLRAVAAQVYGADDPLAAATSAPTLTVETDGLGHVLVLPLPFAEKGTVTAVRAGDDLVVTIAGRRRVLDLPAQLRRCDVAGGEFDGSALRVHFRRARPRPYPTTAKASGDG